MLVDDDSREVSSERDNENKGEVKTISVREESENRVYIDKRGRLCAATPASIIGNGTPPPPSQKHHFTHKHQINFCN